MSDPRAVVDKEAGKQAARPGIFFIRYFINFRGGLWMCTLHISFLARSYPPPRNILFHEEEN